MGDKSKQPDIWFPNVPRSEPGKILTFFAIIDELLLLLLIIGIAYLIYRYF
ncbi:MAG: hypothetical protein OEY49_03555 [Candidatus Heimdallarchaeota archaeon]|nr:hypothetical protein [Candidatus Heimdallarchaeota archaeon]